MKATEILKLTRAKQLEKLEKLNLDELKVLLGELVDEAKTRQLKFSPALINKRFLDNLQEDQLKQQMWTFLKLFPEVQSDRLAIDREFKRQGDRLDAIIEDINNDRLPSYRHWELLHEDLFVEPDVETSILKSSRTFIAYAIPKLKNANVLRNLLTSLKHQLGEVQFKLYMNAPLLLAGMDEAITLEDLYLKKQTNLNTKELGVLNKDKGKKNVLVEYLSLSNGKNTVNIGNIDTHIASAHRSADESHVGAFKLMVEANPNLGISAEYQEHSSAGEKLPRVVEIKDKGKLNEFVAKNLAELKNDIKRLVDTNVPDLYNGYIRISSKDSEYGSLVGEEQEKAGRKVKGLLFMANAALRFMNNMINDHECNSGTYEYKTDDKATCGLTMEEMVAACYWASKDEVNFRQKSSANDVLFALIRQLYDMRRGYDIDHGTDKPEEDIFPEAAGIDSNRCHGGCVNSLASALASIHKAYNVKKIERSDIEGEIKRIYGEIAENNIESIDREQDKEMFEAWSSTGRVTGKFRETLKDIFKTSYRKGFEDDYKGYIDDKIFERVIEDGLDNIPMPKALKQEYAIEEMSVEDIYFAIMNGNIPLLHLDKDMGYESTLNYLSRLKGKEELITQLVSRALAGKIREPGVQRVLLHLSRSNLEEQHGNKEILRIEDKSILLKDIAGLSETILEKVVEAESLNKVLEISIENNIPELLVFYALKLKGNFTREELKATYGYKRETILHLAARAGQTEIVKVILESLSEQARKELLSMRDIFASTPLHSAARAGQTEVVKIMLESLSEQDKKELLSMRDGAGVGNTPLHLAAREGQTEVVKVILGSLSEQDKKEHLSMRDRDGVGSTPLHFAAREGQTEVVKVILGSLSEQARKEHLSIKDKFGNTPLHSAAREGQTEVVKVILESFSEQDKKELLSIRNEVGNTPLHWAVYNGRTEVVKMILGSLSEQARKELLSIRNEVGNALLYWAARAGQTEVVKIMLESLSEQDKKELINAKRNGETPLDMAIGSNSKSEITKLLREYGAKTAAEINRLHAFVGGIIGLTLGSTALYSLHAFTSFPKDIISSAKICAGFAITGAIVGYFADTGKPSQDYRTI
jgi:ankyrin repeat protein